MRLMKQPEASYLLRPEYANSVRHFLAWKQSKPVNEEVLREYFNSLRTLYAASSIRLSKVGLKQWILKTHHQRGNLQFRANVEALFREIKVPKPEVTIHASKILSEKELKVVMNNLSTKYALIFESLYQTGARVSEVLSIKLDNCKPLPDHIEIKILGKHSKEGTLILSKRLFQKIRQEFNGSKFLFENTESRRPFSRQIVHRHLQAIGRKIDRAVYPHQLRHSRITHLLRSGKPLDGVSRFARHFDAGYTARAYGHNFLSSQEIIESSLEGLCVRTEKVNSVKA